MTEIVKVHAARDVIEIWVTAFDGAREISSHAVAPEGATYRWWIARHPCAEAVAVGV